MINQQITVWMPIAYVLAAYRLDNLVGWGAQQLCDDGELVDVVLAWKEGFSFQHLRKDTPCAPYVDLHIVLLPREHNLRRAVVSRRHVSCHLWVLDTRKAKIADLEVAILVDKDVAGLQVAVDDSCRVYVFQTALPLSALSSSSGLGGILGSGIGSIG